MKHVDTVYLDIETIPSTESWVREDIEQNTTPPGNYKNPDTIDRWEKETKPGLVEKNLEKCAFDGAKNHIICIGWAVNDTEPQIEYIDDVSLEQDLIQYFYGAVPKKAGTVYVGHNIADFDLRVLKQRSMVLGVPLSMRIPFFAKPWDSNPYDTMVKWDIKNMTSLDTIAKAFGIEGKNGLDGSMVWDMWKEGKIQEIAEYCKDDVRIVREIYNRMTFQNRINKITA